MLKARHLPILAFLFAASAWTARRAERPHSLNRSSWRGTPLVDVATIVSLTGATRSRAWSLHARTELDRGRYPEGLTVTYTQFATIQFERHRCHGDWSYTIHPASANV